MALFAGVGTATPRPDSVLMDSRFTLLVQAAVVPVGGRKFPPRTVPDTSCRSCELAPMRLLQARIAVRRVANCCIPLQRGVRCQSHFAPPNIITVTSV